MMVVNSKPKAALYLRVSTEEQKKEGFSLGAQEDILKGYCVSKGYEVFEVYNDGGYSGKDFNRPDMQRLLRDSRDQKFDIVLAIAVDRISRSNLDVLTFVDRELHPRGQKLVISTCDIDSSTETGKMFISLLGTFAEYERRLIVGRVKKGMEKRANEGLTNGGRILGYDSVVNADFILTHHRRFRTDPPGDLLLVRWQRGSRRLQSSSSHEVGNYSP
ncbi:recombinase family protein [Brevibacillus humidisoli]|uniref:recombinase family protein n=1 Tax=Brevibacillus humidisoli TaxID=2895522 RepID=UPI001E3165BA|nr:recombinase family protein [Brevibacillus humidisoli]UFJ40396.1 recombinase family protein [Brevibacillus humidisoli]